jgi:uncharacterized membrane protein YagU involved in acid resistance
MKIEAVTKNLALGASAGLVATLFIKGGMVVSKRWVPQLLPPVKKDPGEYLVEKLEQALPASINRKVPPKAESVLAQAFGLGYGVTFGSLYAALQHAPRRPVLDGTLLGFVTWAAGYLGWLPATGLMPPVWKQSTKQVFPNVLSHAVFGIITSAMFCELKKRV